MTDLMPCPFCGGHSIRVNVGLSEFVDGEVTCEDCGGNVGNYPTAAEAIAAWNRRTVQAQIDAAVKAERERCAKVADTYAESIDGLDAWWAACDIADLIRKGDQP